MIRNFVVATVLTGVLPCLAQDANLFDRNSKSELTGIQVNLPGLPTSARSLEMVLIELGTFQMGSLETERGRDANEGPIHEVTLTRSFYIGKYEITQAQWQAVTGVNPSEESGIGDNLPVYGVSWDDCQSFIEQLNALGLGTFRLPTEAEWEYACRAGTGTRFSFGDVLECSDLCSDCELMEEHMWWCGNETGEAHEVGLKKPNRWDLFDMHGNAWEWCEDDWHPNYNGAPTDGRAWMDSPRNIIRVTRGGTWSSFAKGCRSADRNDYIASGYYGDVGLRLVRTVEEVSAVEEAEQL